MKDKKIKLKRANRFGPRLILHVVTAESLLRAINGGRFGVDGGRCDCGPMDEGPDLICPHGN